MAQRLRVAQPLSALFLQQFLEQIELKDALGQQPLEAGALLFKFLDALGLVDCHIPIRPVPAVKRGFGNPMRTADGANGLIALLGLVRDLDDLLGAELAGLHRALLVGGSYHIELASSWVSGQCSPYPG